MFPSTYKEADTVDEESLFSFFDILTGRDSAQGRRENHRKGKGLVRGGERLLKQAEELEKVLVKEVGKRDAEGDNVDLLVADVVDDDDDFDLDDLEIPDGPDGLKAVIRTLRAAAQRSIKAGETIMANSVKIAGALKDAVINITDVVADGVKDVSFAVANVTKSVVKAGMALEKINRYTALAPLNVQDPAKQGSNHGLLDPKAERLPRYIRERYDHCGVV
ncbi:hypothetical protein ElyMa_003855000 [Elysia marginata]|uniref:Talin central domain-containing protein n=1 Tax=Elysia marginata TaxID=1093978 RepID=A0AAV4FJB4_9GAST|nr:hypothetical protein ElyMa_003855000 [Elysia marginata]